MLRLWDTGRAEAWAVPSGSVGLSFNRDGTLLATGSDAGTVRVWNASSGELVDTIEGGVAETRGQFSPATDTLVLADAESPDVRVWSREDGTVTTAFRAPEAEGLNTARFDSEGERIVYADTNGRLAVRTLSSGADVRLGGSPEVVWDAQFSTDGKRVAAISASGTTAVWRLDQPERPERLLEGHRGDVNGLDYGADDRLVTAGSDRTVRVWPARGTTSLALLGHTRDATDAAFSLNGSKVVSASMDRTLRLWDSSTGVMLAVLETAPAEINFMQMSSDGQIATLDEDLTLRVRRCEVCGSAQEVEALARSYEPRQLSRDERRQYLAPLG
jgi:WD40 repeat protein